jgi:hypothetical protein
MAARIDMESGVRVLSRRVVVESFAPPLYDDYDIHRNGRTLALVRAVGDARGREIILVLNCPVPTLHQSSGEAICKHRDCFGISLHS